MPSYSFTLNGSPTTVRRDRGAGTPPIAPAVANAVLALTGTPVRKLPIGKLT